MPETVSTDDIALRLLLAVLAGATIGFNRGEHGRPAGLRTTLLVCTAAAVTMIQANLLMIHSGMASAASIRLDVMRLPLGILSGMGFIGAGAILRRGNAVLGVTTAATLWFVTVIGLCFGGGQLGLGLAATGIGVVTLWGLKWLEQAMPQDKRATLKVVAMDDGGPTADELIQLLRQDKFGVISCAVTLAEKRHTTELHLSFRGDRKDVAPPSLVAAMAGRGGVLEVDWTP